MSLATASKATYGRATSLEGAFDRLIVPLENLQQLTSETLLMSLEPSHWLD